MFWHDQTKVGNFDEGIRICERLFQQLESRQAKTIDRFIQRNGRLPSATDRLEPALFPRATSDRRGLKGVSYGWFSTQFSTWVKGLDLAGAVPPPGSPHAGHQSAAGRCEPDARQALPRPDLRGDGRALRGRTQKEVFAQRQQIGELMGKLRDLDQMVPG
jgi:hypothetical protein